MKYIKPYQLFESADSLYRVGPSSIHGQGCFAARDLEEGTTIGLLHTIGETYQFTELGRMYNHSVEPNCYNKRVGQSRFLVTLRRVKAGEELTADYRLQPDLEQPEDWIGEGQEIGWKEWCTIPDLGRFLAKLDTGNGTKASSLGVDSMKIDGDSVYWSCGGRNRIDPIKDWSLAEVGSTIDKRPIIILDIELGPHRLSEVPIALTDRSDKSTPVLINRDLLSRLGVVVAPNQEFLLGESSLPDASRLAELGLLDGPFITWELTATPRSWIESTNPDIGKFTLHEADGETHWTIYLSSFRESGSDLVAWATSQLHQQGWIPNWQETPIWQELLSAVQDQMHWVALKYVARAWPGTEPGALLPAQCLNTGEWHWLKRPTLPPTGW